MLPRLSDNGQRLHHEPCRIVGILHGQFLLVATLWEERRQVDGLHARLMLGKRYGLGDVLAVGQYGQIVLLAVAEAIAGHHDTTDEQRRGIVLLRQYKVDIGGLAGLHRTGGTHFSQHGFRCGVCQSKDGCSAHSMFRGVDDAGRYLCLITHTDEARHVGLYHHVFLGHGLALDAATEHVGSMGYAHEAPCSQTFGQCEFQCDAPLAVGLQCGIAESGLLQVLAQLYVALVRCFFLLCLRGSRCASLLCCHGLVAANGHTV